MRMKLKIRNAETLAFRMIILFPIIFMIFNILGHNQGLRVFYFIYASVLIILLSGSKHSIKKNIFFMLCLIGIKLVYDIISYPDSISDALAVACLYLLFETYSNEERIDRFGEYLVRNNKFVFVTYLIYLVGLLYTVLFGNGLVHRWGTTSFYGHYNMAHLLAYELLILFATCYFVFTKEKNVKWIILMVIFGVLMLLTTVRTVLLCVLVAVSYIFLRKKGLRKFGIAIVGLIVLYLVFSYTNLFSAVLEKTQYAATLGSATSSRGLIWESSVNFYVTGSTREKLLGQGIQSLMRWNLSSIRMEIQAHNDLISVLAAFGLVSLAAYIISLLRFCRGKGGIGVLLCLLVLIWFNGLYSYASLIIGLPVIKLIFENINSENVKPADNNVSAEYLV